jgi:outer membrane protein assembly factor BamB
MICAYRSALAAVGLLVLLTPVGADWPAFRGADGSGVSAEGGVPSKWGPAENIAWKIKLPGPGSSSPIVWGDRVFVTCYTGVGKGGDPAALRRHLLCLDRKTGALRWQKDVAAVLPETPYTGFITEHGYASSTPATDGARIYVFFGRSGVLAYDFDGNEQWRADVGSYRNGWGSAASPVLYKDFVLVNATVESSSLVALNKKTGKQAWRVKGLGDSWATPVLVTVAGGRVEVVLSTADGLQAFDPQTGAKLWSCDGPSDGAATSTPVARDGIVYAIGGGLRGRGALAVRAGGRGDVTATHVLWTQKTGAGICSPVLAGDYLFWVSGQVSCLRADTGRVVFQQRLYDARGEYASPVAVDGKLIALTRRSGAFVLTAKGAFEQVAHNDLGDATVFNASPAVSAGQLFVRSDAYLYCIGQGTTK